MVRLIIFCLLLLCWLTGYGQPPVILWEKTWGGSANDWALAAVADTTNGSYYIAGYSSSSAFLPDKTTPNKGRDDIWMLKIRSNGTKIYDRTYGGNMDDWTGGILKTKQNIYLLGTTQSIMNGDRLDNNKSILDAWVVKADTLGNKLWAKSYGGDSSDQFFTGLKLSEHKLLFAGYTMSSQSGDIHQSSRGDMDVWVVCTDSSGNLLWERRYGGNSIEFPRSIKQVANNEILIAGFTASQQGFEVSQQPKGTTDAFLIKIDTLGNQIWDNDNGGSESQEILNIEVLDDGECLLAGVSNSPPGGDKTDTNYGVQDIWVFKVDKNGNKIWDKTFGGTDYDVATGVIKYGQYNYMIVGNSNSDTNSTKTVLTKGDRDIWLIGINANGDTLWQKSIGGTDFDESYHVVACGKNQYLLSGTSFSNSSGDKSENSRGYDDMWLIKLGFPDVMSLESLRLSTQWQGNYPYLSWQDQAPDSALFYVIERSSDLKNGFQSIDTLFADQIMDWSYRDKSINNKATHLFYRIARRDRDGYYHYSNITNLRQSIPSTDAFNLSVYPNPFSDIPVCQYQIPQSWLSTVEVAIFDAVGREQYRTTLTDQTGIVNLDTDAWASGIYHCVLQSGGSVIQYVKVIKK